jgi:hypothetical protein
MRNRRTIKEALELINLLKEDYRDCVKTPEDCLEILKKYLPYCKKRDIPFDHLLVRLDIYFFGLIELLPESEFDKYIDLYNSILKRYEISTEDYEMFGKILKEDSTKDSSSDDFVEPSDLELKILERILI